MSQPVGLATLDPETRRLADHGTRELLGMPLDALAKHLGTADETLDAADLEGLVLAGRTAEDIAAMPLPRWPARVNRRVTNRLLEPAARHLPTFGVVAHRGRKSGCPYRTPVNVFRRPGGCVIALTYGPDADWVRNVMAGGGCTLETRGRTLRVTQPRLSHDEQRRAVPASFA